jgi:hypothetical protein
MEPSAQNAGNSVRHPVGAVNSIDIEIDEPAAKGNVPGRRRRLWAVRTVAR